MASILIKTNNNFFDKYKIESKSELSNEFYQNLLKKYHHGGRIIKCGCNPKKEIWMSVVSPSSGKSFLRKFPRIKELHEDDCIFNSATSEFYDDETQTYSLALFKEPQKSDKEKNSSSDSRYTMAKTTTFNSFCIDWISGANAYAFSSVNVKNNRYAANYNFGKFIYALNKSDIKVSKVGSIANIEELKGVFLFKGITFDDLSQYSQKDDLDTVINVSFYDNNKFILKSTIRRLNIATKRLRIFNNFVRPPYFVIASVVNGLAARLFVYPIFFDTKEKNIAFVESENERSMAKKLFDENKVFFKPISNEHSRLNNKKFPYFHSRYRPDFFVFDNNNITIIELSGFDAQGYLEQLEDKEKDYHQIVKFNKNKEIVFSYKRINAETGSIELSF